MSFSDSRVGKLIVNAERLVLWASPAVSSFLGHGWPLALADGRLAANEPSDQLRLEQFIDAAKADDQRRDMLLAGGDSSSGTVALKARGCPGGEGRIAVELRHLDLVFDFDLPDFRSLYGFTPAEHQTVCLILSGLSVSEVALQLCRSVMTVRTSVRDAYSKLNITSKEQLFAITLKLGS
ncbi:MAG TPA: helix-turn-helix transcriptional regulator [Sphingomonadaceae bacterium]|nr:helix-turn-helix transcriptional regulator [Sphingomonadaceae bacterium]